MISEAAIYMSIEQRIIHTYVKEISVLYKTEILRNFKHDLATLAKPIPMATSLPSPHVSITDGASSTGF